MTIHRRALLSFCAALLTVGGVAVAVPAADPANQVILTTKDGKITIQLMPNLAPKAVAQMEKLTKEGFYNGQKFHRVIDGFMAQTGDPTGTGSGGSKEPDLPAEFSNFPFDRGTVGMARTSDPNSANSQFFICFGDSAFLNKQYTVWGKVTSGMENVDKIKRGEPVRDPDSIKTATIS